MNSTHTIGLLNRLYSIHSCSLPAYLSYAKPWGLRDASHTKQVLEQLAHDKADLADRIGSTILQLDGEIAGGEFPMVFTGWHDLSYNFLIRKMIEYQQRDIAAIEQCAAELNSSPAARALAEECLGAAKAHLELLQESAKREATA